MRRSIGMFTLVKVASADAFEGAGPFKPGLLSGVVVRNASRQRGIESLALGADTGAR